MQDKTASPRDSFTAAQIEETLAFQHGGRVRWGVEWDDGTIVREAVRFQESGKASWDAGTHYGTEATLAGLSVHRP